MRQFVSPGEQLLAEARLVHNGSGYAVAEATISAAGRKTAEAEIRYRVVAFPNETMRQTIFETARRIAVPERLFHAA
jgi:3-hydroxyacyl-[acyl-carrier-protein] dehydratase